MIAAVAAAMAAALLAAAVAELTRCAKGPCAERAVPLRTNLVTAAASMAAFAAALGALALIAALRLEGSADAAMLSIWAASLASLLTAVTMGYLGNAMHGFNACLGSLEMGKGGDTTAVIMLAILIIAMTLVMTGHGVINGAIPVPAVLPIAS